MAKFILGALTALALTACGGGDGDAPGKGPTQAPPASCQPIAAVNIQMFGDSTYLGYGASTDSQGNITYAPAAMIQRAMDARFGAGAVKVYDNASAGTTSTQLIDGTDGINAPWPGSVMPTAHIVIVNHGINDEEKGTPLATYKANFEAFASLKVPVVLQTASPTLQAWDNPAYAQTVRDVAAATGAGLADVQKYMSGIGNLDQYLADGIHPNDLGYQAIVNNVTLPALMPLVAKLKCQ